MDIDRPPDIVVIAGGARVDPHTVRAVDPATRVIAADAGVQAALDLGWSIDLAVGDFDSLAPDLIARLDDIAGDVHRYEADKDATDLELALVAASAHAPARVLVAGIEGGRPDHALANLQLVASSRFAALEIEVALHRGRGWAVHQQLHGSVPAGTLLSVIPMFGPATVSATGVRWPLRREALAPGGTRGVSNEVISPRFTVTVHSGAVLCISPHTESEESS